MEDPKRAPTPIDKENIMEEPDSMDDSANAKDNEEIPESPKKVFVFQPQPIPSGKPTGKRLAVLQNGPSSPAASVVSVRSTQSSVSRSSRSTKRSVVESDDSENVGNKKSRAGKAKSVSGSGKSKGKRRTKAYKVKTAHTVDPNSTSNVGQVTEDEYIVEKIVTKKVDEDGTASYWIKWKGWASCHNTWEPKENLTGCPDLLEKFEKAEAEKLARARKSKGGKSSDSGSMTGKGHAINRGDLEYDQEDRMKKTKAELVEFGIHDSWPTNEIPIKMVGVVDINKKLTYIVKVQCEEDNESADKENVQSENAGNKKDTVAENYNSNNVIVIYSTAFRYLFPQIVIDYYQKQVLWATPEDTAEEVAVKAAEAFKQTKSRDNCSMGSGTVDVDITEDIPGCSKINSGLEDHENESEMTEVIGLPCNADKPADMMDVDEVKSDSDEDQPKITIRKDIDLYGLPEDMDSSRDPSSNDEYESDHVKRKPQSP